MIPLLSVLPASAVLLRVAQLTRAGKSVGTWFANFISRHPILTAGVVSIPLATHFVSEWNRTPEVRKLQVLSELQNIDPELVKLILEFEAKQKQEWTLLLVIAGIIVIMIIIIFVFKR